ncbi:unnamed protein product [Sphenostylis stenocarpa]|uniref:Uncharacterized protein n=1 Tax=Sphenostylis stenocarpa TaxID=92480 RepID=A0AA86VXB7_9FABA|nr:unnamed protein product [Sphenostylis stenocarpa]
MVDCVLRIRVFGILENLFIEETSVFLGEGSGVGSGEISSSILSLFFFFKPISRVFVESLLGEKVELV